MGVIGRLFGAWGKIRKLLSGQQAVDAIDQQLRGGNVGEEITVRLPRDFQPRYRTKGGDRHRVVGIIDVLDAEGVRKPKSP